MFPTYASGRKLRVSVVLLLVIASSFMLHSQSANRVINPVRIAPQPTEEAQTAYQAAIPNRISNGDNWSQLQPLFRHLPLWANPQNETGLAESEMTLTMVLSRTPEQQAALEKLLANQKNPSSPDFHHWLTPAEFGVRFGVSDSDILAIKTWLQERGLRVSYVAPSRTFIGFSGAAATVGHAFGTEIHSYRVNGTDRRSVSSDPILPIAIAPLVKAIQGLYTIEDRPAHFMTNPQLARPELTINSGTNFIVPMDFTTIYDGIVSYSGYQ